MRAGGRFNPRDEFGAIYLSLERETAIRELLRYAERLGIEPSALAPRAIFTLEVKLLSVLDLTDPEIRGAFLVDLDDLKDLNWTRCQEIARLARNRGYEAIRFPSATSSGHNLAVFLDCLDQGSRVEVVHTELLRLEVPSSTD